MKFRLLLQHANVTPTEFLSVGYFLFFGFLITVLIAEIIVHAAEQAIKR